jgi:DNA-binding NtrC family response regulator
MTRKLLVVDDQAGINAAVECVAADLGLQTMAIREPLKATEAFIAFAPDIVLRDMIMPEKDGIEVLVEMMLTGRPARFIVMSGYGDSYLRLAQGVAAFHGAEQVAVLRKPFRREELEAMLCSMLGIGPAHSASTRPGPGRDAAPARFVVATIEALADGVAGAVRDTVRRRCACPVTRQCP